MAEPLLPFLTFRVLDPVSGAELIHDLPHPHQSTWTIAASQQGAAASSAVGNGTIPLFPPLTDQYKAARSDYSQLAYGQRIEGYLGVVGTGDPKVTGYITALPTRLNNYAIGVQDSTWLAQMARTDRTYAFNGTTDTLFKNSLKAYGLVYGDDTWASLSGYTNSGTLALTSREVGPVLNGVSNSTSTGDGLCYTTTSYANAKYADCVVDGLFNLQCSNVAGNVAEGGVIAAVTDDNNLILGRMVVQCTSTGHFQYRVQLYKKVAGVYTSLSNLPFTYDTSQGQIRCQVRLFGTQSGANYTWRVVVNGYDQGCTATYAMTPSGAVGFRLTNATTSFATQLCFQNKQSLFAQGTITAGTKTINQTYSRTPLIDLWNIAAGTEGYRWRKNPKAGLFADTVDFGAFGTVGTDVTASVRFEEGLNLVDCAVDPNAEQFGTELELSGVPGTNNQGSITWHNITAQKTLGVVSNSVSFPDMADPISQLSAAKIVADQRATPGFAKTLTVLYEPSTAEKWRELDKITVHAPSEGIFNQSVQVLNYTLTEGSAQQTIVADAVPMQAAQHTVARLTQTVERLANRTSSVTGNVLTLDVNGNAAYDGTGVIGAMASLGFQAAGSAQAFVGAGVGTWADVTGSSFTITLARPLFIDYRVFATAFISAGAGSGYVRGNIVSVNTSASIIFGSASTTSGFIWYYDPIVVPPGTYTVKMQAGADVGTTLTFVQYFHQVFQLGA